MTDPIQPASTYSLLYDLSLAIGTSLDAHENCQHFLQKLVALKGFESASVWLKNSSGEAELFCTVPAGFPKAPGLNRGLLESTERLGDFGILKLGSAAPSADSTELAGVIKKFTLSLEACLAHERLVEEARQRDVMQKALRRLNHRYTDLFQNMYDALLLLDAGGRVKEANAAACQLLGCGTEEVAGINFHGMVHPDDVARFQPFLAQLKTEGFYSGFEGRIFTKNGEVRHVQVNSNAIFENKKLVGSRDILRDVTEQKRVERRVSESEATLRQVVDYSLDAVVTFSAGGLVTEWSKQAERMFGILREEAIGAPLASLIFTPEYRTDFDRVMASLGAPAGRGGVNKRVEIKALRQQSLEFPAELSISVLRKGGGHFFSAFIRDITERRRSEEALQNAQIRLTSLVTNLQAGVLLENENRETLLANRYFCEVFNIPVVPAWLYGKDGSKLMEDLWPQFTDADGFGRGVGELVEKKERVIGQTLHLCDGRILERDFIPLFSEKKYLGHLWQFRDVTEKHKAQQAIRESEEKYRGIIENMELGLLEVDTGQCIVRTNQAFCEMTGYAENELAGQNALGFLVAETDRETVRQQAQQLETGQPCVYEVQLCRKDGQHIWALISAAPRRNSAGQVAGSIGIHFDLTARKKLELDLAAAKQAAEQARLAERQFLANMSHEIRTPMNAVIGMAHLLGDTPLTAPQKDYLDSLRFSADSLLGIIDNVLDLSKIEAGELAFEEKNFDLSHLLRSLQRTFQFKVKEKPISVVLDFDPNIAHLVGGDPTRLNQILTNLLGNACKFTEQGTVGLRAQLLASTTEKYVVEFRVHDTGIGIAKDRQEAIFQNFTQADVRVTRKFGGTGLGLTIVKQLVERQGGSIRVQSEEGRGATFVFTLPLKNSGLPPAKLPALSEEPTASNQAGLENLSLLVVEDNLMNQKLITQILRTWGSHFQLATDGFEALDLSQAEVFDLVLMDLHMPGMDGVEATTRIRANPDNPNQQTPIVALTAAALLEEKTRALDSGMNEFLTKPFSPRKLEECIVQLLGGKGIFLTKKTPAPAAGKTAAPPAVKIDLKYLLEFSNGDRAFVTGMVETFLCETPAALATLEVALSAGDWELVYRTVHTLKPNFMMLGMEAQRGKCLEVEKEFKSSGQLSAAAAKTVRWLVASARQAFPVLEAEVAVGAD